MCLRLWATRELLKVITLICGDKTECGEGFVNWRRKIRWTNSEMTADVNIEESEEILMSRCKEQTWVTLPSCIGVRRGLGVEDERTPVIIKIIVYTSRMRTLYLSVDFKSTLQFNCTVWTAALSTKIIIYILLYLIYIRYKFFKINFLSYALWQRGQWEIFRFVKIGNTPYTYMDRVSTLNLKAFT